MGNYVIVVYLNSLVGLNTHLRTCATFFFLQVLSGFNLNSVIYISGKALNMCTNFTIDLVQPQASSYNNDNIHLRLKVQLKKLSFKTVVAAAFGGLRREVVGWEFKVAVDGNHFTYY